MIASSRFQILEDCSPRQLSPSNISVTSPLVVYLGLSFLMCPRGFSCHPCAARGQSIAKEAILLYWVGICFQCLSWDLHETLRSTSLIFVLYRLNLIFLYTFFDSDDGKTERLHLLCLFAGWFRPLPCRVSIAARQGKRTYQHIQYWRVIADPLQTLKVPPPTGTYCY